jgi:hypothetical protein
LKLLNSAASNPLEYKFSRNMCADKSELPANYQENIDSARKYKVILHEVFTFEVMYIAV